MYRHGLVTYGVGIQKKEYLDILSDLMKAFEDVTRWEIETSIQYSVKNGDGERVCVLMLFNDRYDDDEGETVILEVGEPKKAA